nr:immunoglobulin heavy chain junction region [Mus musculus]
CVRDTTVANWYFDVW